MTRHVEPSTLDQAREGLVIGDLRVNQGAFELTADNWQASPGSVVGLVGANGAGKTTFIRAIAGALQRSTGTVEIGGIPTVDFGWRLPEMVGWVADTLLGLEDFSVLDHLHFCREIYANWDMSYANELIKRLNIPTQQRLKTLSHGTRIKAAFTMVEAARPAVLLLDEPTSGLDPLVRQELLGVLGEIRQFQVTRTVVFSTHILEDLADVATGVSLVRRGHVYAPNVDAGDASWRRCESSARPAVLSKLFGAESFG